ncbi:MAG TPA: hypothetical protein VFW07_23370 [Parafilimonas sp.]|nr:hypothetical protein [Parafilimonas sp.]
MKEINGRKYECFSGERNFIERYAILEFANWEIEVSIADWRLQIADLKLTILIKFISFKAKSFINLSIYQPINCSTTTAIAGLHINH